MDDATKTSLKAELSLIKGMIPAAASMTATMQQSTFPVAGSMVNIHSLPMAAQAIKLQNDSLTKIVGLLEKIVDAS